MRVLHLTETLEGGVASYLDEVIPGQVARYGAESVRLVVPDRGVDHLRRTPMATIKPFPKTKRTPRGILDFREVVLKSVGDFAPDILHLHSTFAGFAGRLIPWPSEKKPKVVYCAHGWAFSSNVSIVKRSVYALAEAALALRCDAIINISRADAATAKAHFVGGHQVTIRNGVSDAYDVAPSPLRLAPGAINLLFVGRHDKQKGLDIIEAAMERVSRKDVHLHVIGDAVLSAGTRKRSSAGTINYYGWQDRSAVNAAMEACDALVVPSRWEGFGLVVAEAMRCSTGALVSSNGALPELVHHGVNGLVIRDNTAEAWARSFEALDQAELVTFGEAARRTFVHHFEADRMESEIADLYKRLIST